MMIEAKEKDICLLLDYSKGRVLLANAFNSDNSGCSGCSNEVDTYLKELKRRRKWVRRTMRKRYNK